MMEDEILDLVNEQDQIIGQLPRLKVYEQQLRNFRVVNAFVMNAKGALWIPRRTATKRIFPLCLDTSMGGHVSAGETYQQAFQRELQEELGLDSSIVAYEIIGYLTPQEHDTSAFMQVYLIKAEQVPLFNQKDFCEYFWLTPQELMAKLTTGDSAKSDLPKIVRQLF